MSLPATITFDVTQSHIDHGVRNDCTNCPIALALEQATQLPWMVSTKECKTRGATYRTHPAAASFIRSFDRHGYAKPATFTIQRAVLAAEELVERTRRRAK